LKLTNTNKDNDYSTTPIYVMLSYERNPTTVQPFGSNLYNRDYSGLLLVPLTSRPVFWQNVTLQSIGMFCFFVNTYGRNVEFHLKRFQQILIY